MRVWGMRNAECGMGTRGVATLRRWSAPAIIVTNQTHLGLGRVRGGIAEFADQ